MVSLSCALPRFPPRHSAPPAMAAITLPPWPHPFQCSPMEAEHTIGYAPLRLSRWCQPLPPLRLSRWISNGKSRVIFCHPRD